LNMSDHRSAMLNQILAIMPKNILEAL